MAEGRPPIPRELRRAVLVEAGHRCAIPTCRAHPVDIEHIDDWAKVREHRFENLIALCPTCHRRKGNGPDQIDRRSLQQYKINLGVLNSQYGEFERRVLDSMAWMDSRGMRNITFKIPVGMELLVLYLMRDGYLELVVPGNVVEGPFAMGGIPLLQEYRLTEAGQGFVRRWKSAEPLD